MTQRTVTPCFDCGHLTGELKELEAGSHLYHQFHVFGETIVLCDFCDADFGSYYPSFFGLPGEVPADQEYDLELICQIESPTREEDLYCAKCDHRHAFLSFLKAARERHQD